MSLAYHLELRFVMVYAAQQHRFGKVGFCIAFSLRCANHLRPSEGAACKPYKGGVTREDGERAFTFLPRSRTSLCSTPSARDEWEWSRTVTSERTVGGALHFA